MPVESDSDAGWEVLRDHVRERVRARLFGADVAASVRLGRFELRERLGEGGMGVVFRAHDPKLARDVALKVVRSRAVASAMDAGLVQEAQAMARVAHPNVAAVHEVGEHGGTLFIAMELVDGGTLRDWVQGRSPATILPVLIAVGRGLSAAHERGLIHRDVKPENVLIGVDGRPRVVDFGLVRLTMAAGGHEASETDEGARVGTPSYMAPEQLRGEIADSLSDQFGFSATCFEALYGRRPFAPDDGEALLAAIEQRALVPVERGHPCRHLLEPLRRGLHPDANARFPTVAALVDAIEAAERRARRARNLRRGAAMTVPLAVVAALVAFAATRPEAPPDRDEGLPFPAYVELSELVQQGRFAECVTRSLREDPTPQLLNMRIECARAGKDRPALDAACAELASRHPDQPAPAACAKVLAEIQALFQAGRYAECIDRVEAAPPDQLLMIEMHKCASKLRDRNTFVRVCRFQAKHFPEQQSIENCPEPLP